MDRSETAPSVTPLSGPEACDKKACLDAEAQRIEALRMPYHFMGPNSNNFGLDDVKRM